MRYDLEKMIFEDLRQRLQPKRFNHVCGVVETSEYLCKLHGGEIKKARLAAVLHDYAKGFSKEEQVAFLKERGIVPDWIEENTSELLHGKVAAVIAQEKYGIDDTDILNAIFYHTTGRADMSKIEVIVALADYIEPSRNYPGVEALRKYAAEDLYYALYKALGHTIEYLLKDEKLIHPLTLEARNDLLFRYDLWKRGKRI